MLVEEVSEIHSSHERGFDKTYEAQWNGRTVTLGKNDRSFDTLFCANESDTKSSISSDVSAKSDVKGNSSVSGSVQYETQSKDSKGNTSSVSVEAKGTVDNKGQASGEAKVTYKKEF